MQSKPTIESRYRTYPVKSLKLRWDEDSDIG
jgi:hypothetical protein